MPGEAGRFAATPGQTDETVHYRQDLAEPWPSGLRRAILRARRVEPGKIYGSLEEARADARKLASVNPVGFVVYRVKGRRYFPQPS